MGRRKYHQKSKSTNSKYHTRNIRNIKPLPENYESINNEIVRNNRGNGNNDYQLWWDELKIISNGNCLHAYTPKWSRLCSDCGSQLLSSEPKNFCCNPLLRHLISPLRPLPPILQNLYEFNNTTVNFSHLSRQYNSLFSFTTLGYTGGVIHLPHLHAFAINGRAYHQIHPANTEGYPVNWFVYDAMHEILRNMSYPQAQLVIQQSTANAEIATCTIVHSTAIAHERCIQIWRTNETKPEYINILNKHYEALQYPLFFPYGEIGWHIYWTENEHSDSRKISQVDYYCYRIMTETRFHLLGRLFNEYLVDMFSRADDERLQFIRKEQHRFQKGGQEEDESLGDEAETHPNNIYLLASHTLSYRCILKNNQCRWNYSQTIQEQTIIDEQGKVHYQRCTEHDINIVPYNAFLLLKLNSHINVEVASTSHVISYLYKYIYKGPDRAMINVQLEENNRSEHEIIDEINDYLNARYLSAIEATWRIFKYRIVSQSPSVTCLPIYLPEEQIILHGNINNNLSSLQCYFLRPSNPEFENLTYCRYNELYLFSYAEESINQNSLSPNTYLENKQEGYCQRIVRPYKQ
ncbi:16506_t:CDS:2, partial [Cetraspora pellucida]